MWATHLVAFPGPEGRDLGHPASILHPRSQRRDLGHPNLEAGRDVGHPPFPCPDGGRWGTRPASYIPGLRTRPGAPKLGGGSRYGPPAFPMSRRREMGHPANFLHPRSQRRDLGHPNLEAGRDVGHPPFPCPDGGRLGHPANFLHPRSQRRDLGHPNLEAGRDVGHPPRSLRSRRSTTVLGCG